MSRRVCVCAVVVGFVAAAWCRGAEGGRSDWDRLGGTQDHIWSIDAGLGTLWLTDFGFFGLSAARDVLGRQDARGLELSYTYPFRLGGFVFLPSAGMRWKSHNLVDCYHGGQLGEAGADRPTHEDSTALDPFVRLAVRRKMTPRWSLLASAQYEWLDESITDSPVADADYDAFFTIGMSCSW
ncbi:MAG: MipA/OmpV family protein [Sedimentisphaerales bacterium]|nr:MipA/OmpV family protein [Sedimentisphaerales bacterium]